MDTAIIPLISAAARTNADLLERALERLGKLAESDPELRRSAPRPDVIEALQNDRLAAIEVFQRACAAYGDRPALGERAFALEPAPGGRAPRFLPAWNTITYRNRLAAHGRLGGRAGPGPAHRPSPGEIAGIYRLRQHRLRGRQPCLPLLPAAVSAVLQTGMAAEDLRHLVNEAGVRLRHLLPGGPARGAGAAAGLPHGARRRGDGPAPGGGPGGRAAGRNSGRARRGRCSTLAEAGRPGPRRRAPGSMAPGHRRPTPWPP